MNDQHVYSLQRTMIIYILLIGFAALMVASEFVLETHSASLKQQLGSNSQRHTDGELSTEKIYDPLVRMRNKAMMMVGVILAVVVIVLTMFIKTITEPLQHMVRVSRAIGAGDLSHTARVDARNELAQLSTAIDEMATNLQEIIMLSRAVCDSAGRVTRNTSVLVADAPLAPGDANAMAAQLAGLTSELDTLGQVIDCFKLYSVDRRL